MKTEVYSWRVADDLKNSLEREARRRKLSLSAVLDIAAREWLQSTTEEIGSEDEEKRLRDAAMKCFGAFASGDASRSTNARQSVRDRLRRRHDR